MNTKTALAALALVGLCGCVTQGGAPTAMRVEKSRTFDAPFDVVWPAIIDSIAEQNLPITTLEKVSGLIAISGVSYSPNDANEGYRGAVMGVPDLVTARAARFNIFATSQEGGKTTVKVNTSFTMQVRTGNGSNLFPYRYQTEEAFSNGNFEKRVFSEISYRVNHGPELKRAVKTGSVTGDSNDGGMHCVQGIGGTICTHTNQ
ncbi:hypothetical protein [Burkholderia stagnalis]|uniref:hypothetical protein n=1 Tax=Burkholderia stagnalis TaxID=1503054 RepID=UPI0012D9D6EF|nr:hypothetical protein [Burkholderia stagnalis]